MWVRIHLKHFSVQPVNIYNVPQLDDSYNVGLLGSKTDRAPGQPETSLLPSREKYSSLWDTGFVEKNRLFQLLVYFTT